MVLDKIIKTANDLNTVLSLIVTTSTIFKAVSSLRRKRHIPKHKRKKR
ncbi:hypothetical protein M2S00_06575 [Apilactobacillus sp. TMW 2.2459]|nr:hypothetical protein [Apilactobacillus xinyiensis]MCL0312768.1 hypothetical protein [Apilactobacillus xinyiensis]